MPLPKPRWGKSPEKKSDFISRCAGDPVANKEFPDQKQRLGYCYSAWERRKAKASYVIKAADDEYIYITARATLPAAMIERVKSLPESGPGYHNVKVRYKGGKTYSGRVLGGEEFECDDDEIEDLDDNDIEDVEMDD